MKEPLDPLLESALTEAHYTKDILLGHGAIGELPSLIRHRFRSHGTIVIADTNTFNAAGKRIRKMLKDVGLSAGEPFILNATGLHATMPHVTEVQNFLSQHPTAVPLAVGGGTINDLVKLASHNLDRQYVCVATAASVDGFASYSASIDVDGHKQTVFCPAPLSVVADLDIICNAPTELNSAGYGDMLAKFPSGVDWILADALDVELIDPTAWQLVQQHISEWTSNPTGIIQADSTALRNIFTGLAMMGVAMDLYQGTRPCSGAEHQFSHLLDMTNHTHNNLIPLHGIKVGIGTIATTKLQEKLLQNFDPSTIDIPTLKSNWPSLQNAIAKGQSYFNSPTLKAIVEKEFTSKYFDADQLEYKLTVLKYNWPALKYRIEKQHVPTSEIKSKLAAAGCPTSPLDIGLSFERLKQLYRQSYYTRSRFTILDVAVMLNQLDNWVDEIFASPW